MCQSLSSCLSGHTPLFTAFSASQCVSLIHIILSPQLWHVCHTLYTAPPSPQSLRDSSRCLLPSTDPFCQGPRNSCQLRQKLPTWGPSTHSTCLASKVSLQHLPGTPVHLSAYRAAYDSPLPHTCPCPPCPAWNPQFPACPPLSPTLPKPWSLRQVGVGR